MKKLLFIFCIVLVLASCNNATKDATVTGDSATAAAPAPAEKIEYPYNLNRPYQNWQTGDQQHAVTAMKALKAFENGDVSGCMAYFADSVELRFDYMQAKLSNDSLKKYFTKQRADYTSMKIDMQDWEPVISSDKKEEWVTMWYKQTWTDKKGKTDSLSVIDDCKMVNGKIALLDEKVQHYPVPAKK